jgi:hypothetical protein
MDQPLQDPTVVAPQPLARGAVAKVLRVVAEGAVRTLSELRAIEREIKRMPQYAPVDHRLDRAIEAATATHRTASAALREVER